MYIFSGALFDTTLPHVVGGNQYPAGWFEDAAARAAAGIEPLFGTTPPAITVTQKRTVTGYVRDGQNRWVEVWVVSEMTAPEIAARDAALRAKADAAIAATYLDVDAVYVAAIGQRQSEYTDAETAARAYAAAGYAGTPSAYVTGFAANNPTGIAQTNRWSADQIIARADAFVTAKLAMRNTRFLRQADMRAATTEAALSTAIANWNGFIAALRAQLGL